MKTIKLTEEDKKRVERGMEKWNLFIHGMASKYKNRVAGKDDLVQEGYVALINAVQHFKEDKNASFDTFSFACIRNGILKASASTFSPTSAPGGSGHILDYSGLRKRTSNVDNIPVYGNEFDVELLDLIEAFDINKVGYFYFIEKYSLDELAEKTNKSPANISRMLKKMRKQIAKELAT